MCDIQRRIWQKFVKLLALQELYVTNLQTILLAKCAIRKNGSERHAPPINNDLCNTGRLYPTRQRLNCCSSSTNTGHGKETGLERTKIYWSNVRRCYFHSQPILPHDGNNDFRVGVNKDTCRHWQKIHLRVNVRLNLFWVLRRRLSRISISSFFLVVIEIFNLPKAAQTHIEYKSKLKIHSELNDCSTGCSSVAVLFTKFASLCIYNSSMSRNDKAFNEMHNISNKPRGL